MSEIKLQSNLLGTIGANVEQTIEGTYAAVLISAEILGQTLLGCFNKQNNTVKFTSNQTFFTDIAKKIDTRNEKFRIVSDLIRAKVSDKKARFTLLTEFEVKVSAENLSEIQGLYRAAIATKPVAKTNYSPKRHKDGCECEECEWNDDQNYSPSSSINDANLDESIEESSRIGVN